MAASTRTAPDEWQCRVFIAVVEGQGTQAAADRLTGERGERYNRQSVEKHLTAIRDWYGRGELLERRARKLYPTPAGQEFLAAARRVVAEYRLMRGPATRGRTLACLPHHTHFVAPAERILRAAEPRAPTDTAPTSSTVDGEGLAVVYLDQTLRGEGAFHGQAVQRLQERVYDLIIGPAVPDQDTFESIELYVAQLEVMVPAGYPRPAMALGDLVTRYRLFVPPPDMRSRRLIEEAIQLGGFDDPGPATRIAGETYETGTSVMRIRNEYQPGNRVLVVPSDVALAYKPGMEFGGRGAERFRWVPLLHRDRPLTLEVCVTVRRDKSERPALQPVVRALTEAVAQLNASAPVGLSGERVPPS